MNHADHVDLLRPGVFTPGRTWADLGAGSGAFTLALAELLGSGGVIYAVDKDRQSLQRLQKTAQAQFPAVTVHLRVADFTEPLSLPRLDGLVMANSLHYVKRKLPLLRQLRQYLRPGSQLLLVEYNTDRGNMWVPHPLSYHTWAELAPQAGFENIRLLATKPSRFLGEFFAAAATLPP